MRTLWPYLHGSTLRPAPNSHAFSIIRPILLGKDVLENGQLIIINIKEIILFIIVVVKIDDAQIITWALIIFLLSSILIKIDAHFIFFNFIYGNLVLCNASALVKVPFKYQIIALFIVLGIESMSRSNSDLRPLDICVIEPLNYLVLEAIVNWSLMLLDRAAILAKYLLLIEVSFLFFLSVQAIAILTFLLGASINPKRLHLYKLQQSL
jgi:hypothetical protein